MSCKLTFQSQVCSRGQSFFFDKFQKFTGNGYEGLGSLLSPPLPLPLPPPPPPIQDFDTGILGRIKEGMRLLLAFDCAVGEGVKAGCMGFGDIMGGFLSVTTAGVMCLTKFLDFTSLTFVLQF